MSAESIRTEALERFERKFEKGENHFVALSVRAAFLLLLRSDEFALRADINRDIIDSMLDHDATGAVYATRRDLGNGPQDSSDLVLITARQGESQLMTPPIFRGQDRLVIREETPDFRKSLLAAKIFIDKQ